MSGDDDERRYAPTTTNPGSFILSKFIGYGSVDAEDEAEGLEASTLLHQPIEVDGLLCYSGSFSFLCD